MLWSSIQRAVGSLLSGIQAHDQVLQGPICQLRWRGVGWGNLLASLLSRLWRIPANFSRAFYFRAFPTIWEPGTCSRIEGDGWPWRGVSWRWLPSTPTNTIAAQAADNEDPTEKPWLARSYDLKDIEPWLRWYKLFGGQTNRLILEQERVSNFCFCYICRLHFLWFFISWIRGILNIRKYWF